MHTTATYTISTITQQLYTLTVQPGPSAKLPWLLCCGLGLEDVLDSNSFISQTSGQLVVITTSLADKVDMDIAALCDMYVELKMGTTDTPWPFRYHKAFPATYGSSPSHPTPM